MQDALKKYAFAGLLVVVPVATTWMILKFVIDTADALASPLILYLVRQLEFDVQPGFRVPGLGVFVLLAGIFGVGLLVSNYFGRQLLVSWDGLLERIPLVRGIYHGAKSAMRTIADTDLVSLRRVRMAAFPPAESFAYGMVTGSCKGEVEKKLGEKFSGKKFVCVFVPSTPNFTCGYLLFMPEAEAAELTLTPDRGFHSLLSLGILDPAGAQKPAREE